MHANHLYKLHTFIVVYCELSCVVQLCFEDHQPGISSEVTRSHSSSDMADWAEMWVPSSSLHTAALPSPVTWPHLVSFFSICYNLCLYVSSFDRYVLTFNNSSAPRHIPRLASEFIVINQNFLMCKMIPASQNYKD